MLSTRFLRGYSTQKSSALFYTCRGLSKSTTKRMMSSTNQRSYSYLKVEEPAEGVAQITLNRPKNLNALNSALIRELSTALEEFTSRKASEPHAIRCILLTGSEKSFAAGADIPEIRQQTPASALTEDFLGPWTQLTTCAIPILALVSGFALGGGCELAMMCDMLYCTKTAKFGQPEIKLGLIPGAGGTQRLTRAIGKSRAMELILTGSMFSGEEATAWGLASKCFDTHEELLQGGLKTAKEIARQSSTAIIMAKAMVNRSQDLGLRDGTEHERRVFQGLLGSRDAEVGMTAFIEKKDAKWTHS